MSISDFNKVKENLITPINKIAPIIICKILKLNISGIFILRNGIKSQEIRGPQTPLIAFPKFPEIY